MSKLIRSLILLVGLLPFPAFAAGTFFWNCESETLDSDSFSAGDTSGTASGAISISATTPLKGSNSCLTTNAQDYYIFDSAGIAATGEGAFSLLFRWTTTAPTGTAVYKPLSATDSTDDDGVGFSLSAAGVPRVVIRQTGSAAEILSLSTTEIAADTTYFMTGGWDIAGDRRYIRVYDSSCSLIEEAVDTTTDLSGDQPGNFDQLRVGNSTSLTVELRADTVVWANDYDDNLVPACAWTRFKPTYTSTPVLDTPTDTTLPFDYTTDHTGTTYAAACADGQTVTSFANLKSGTCSGGAAVGTATDSNAQTVADTVTITGLAAGQTYDVYIGQEDVLGWQSDITSLADQQTTGASGPEFSAGPDVTPASDGYQVGGTITNGNATVYGACLNPGASAPIDCDALQALSGSAPLFDSELWTADAADTFLVQASGAWPKHDCYVCADNGVDPPTAISSFPDELRSEDANQGIVTLTSVAPTSPFAVQTVANCDTTDGMATVTGCGDTSWLQPGMRVDLSAGFADLTDVIVEAVTADMITFETTANATTADITVTQDPYFSPAVAAADTVEADDLNSAGEAVTVEADGDLSFTPSAQTYRTLDYNIQDVSDASDGDFDAGPPAWASGDDTLHFFSVRPEFDSDLGLVPYLFYVDQALSGISLECNDQDGQATSVTSRSSPPTGTSIATNGEWTGTPTVEDESGSTLVLDCADSGELYATPVPVIVYVTDDQIQAPDCVTGGVDVPACIAALDGVRPWLDEGDQLNATFTYSDSVASGDIISQDPAASANMNALDPLSVVVSLGETPAGRPRIRLDLGISLRIQ